MLSETILRSAAIFFICATRSALLRIRSSFFASAVRFGYSTETTTVPVLGPAKRALKTRSVTGEPIFLLMRANVAISCT